MRFTSKDVFGLVLAATAVVVAMAVTYGWGWPLLGDYRAGTVALGAIGIAMCAGASDVKGTRMSDPFIVLATLLGITALGLFIAGLVWATAQIFAGLVAAIIGLWLVATVRHLLATPADPAAKPALS
jgi:hypothetical protein